MLPGARAGSLPEPSATCRAACSYGAGDRASLTLADQAALHGTLPIDTIVLVMQENRTFVSHQVTDHTSILRFIEARFDLPAATVDQAAADACGAKYP